LSSLKKKKKRKKRRRKLGRPKGCALKKFEETRIGFFLQHEAPIEYQLLKEVTEQMKFRFPPADLIEAICYSSDDPFFRKTKFWRSLIAYRKYGCRPSRAIKTDARKELYYIRRKLKQYVV
jgi:hypothetical protein